MDQTPEPEVRARREHVERQAMGLFAVAAITMAIVCGSIIVSGWFAGVIQDSYERIFWTGALAAGLMIVALAVAAWPGGGDDRRAIVRATWFMRVGLALAVIAPTLCIGALVADFFL